MKLSFLCGLHCRPLHRKVSTQASFQVNIQGLFINLRGRHHHRQLLLPKMQRLLVLGGNGYVGQHICHAALQSGKYIVQSFSRSGRPAHPSPCLIKPLAGSAAGGVEKIAINNVEWLTGDIFDAKRRDEVFAGVDIVVSTIGAFGSNEFMERICGDATVEAVDSAVQHDGSKFGFVSSAQVGKLCNSRFNTPSMPLYGYFKGKEKAEKAIREAFEDSHVIVRPGFIYGPRMAGSIGPLPLQLVGAPINFVSTQLGPVSSLIQAIPFVGTECSSMVHVNAVSQAMVQTLGADDGLTLSAEDIRKFA
jgi:nucleoside-diphosphate-sugar epimerase